jgi:Endoribonuclease L-PSP
MHGDKIKPTLEKQGAELGDVVKATTYVTDIRGIGDNFRCRSEAFAGLPQPAGTLVGVTSLSADSSWPFPCGAIHHAITAAGDATISDADDLQLHPFSPTLLTSGRWLAKAAKALHLPIIVTTTARDGLSCQAKSVLLRTILRRHLFEYR